MDSRTLTQRESPTGWEGEREKGVGWSWEEGTFITAHDCSLCLSLQLLCSSVTTSYFPTGKHPRVWTFFLLCLLVERCCWWSHDLLMAPKFSGQSKMVEAGDPWMSVSLGFSVVFKLLIFLCAILVSPDLTLWQLATSFYFVNESFLLFQQMFFEHLSHARHFCPHTGNTVPWWTREPWSPQLVSGWPKVGGIKLKSALNQSSSLWVIAWGVPSGWDALTSDFHLSGFYMLFPSQLQHHLPRDAFLFHPVLSPFLLPSLSPSHYPHPQFQIQTPLKAKRISLLTWVKVH